MLTAFARSLSAIKERTGQSYRDLAKGSLMSAAALHRYCTGMSVPPDFAVILRFARSHGASRGEVVALHQQWIQARYAAEPPTDRPVPRQLPTDVETFTGRETVIARLADRVGLTVIQGAPGVGKSALAVHIAHRLSGRFPDGQLYVNLQGAASGLSPLLPVEALGRLLRGLGVGAEGIPTNVDEAAATLRTTLAGQRVLLLLDDAVETSQVLPLLPGAPGCGVLITSRRLLTGLPDALYIQLPELTEDESLTLLRRMTQREFSDATLAQLCGGLPLALSIAATRLNSRPHWTAEQLAQHLSAARRRLDQLETADTSVRASFSVSFDDLRSSKDVVDREAARLFPFLGMPHAPDLTVPVAAALFDADEDAALTALERLVDVHLLAGTEFDRYRLHDLLRLYARELAGELHTDKEIDEAVHRVLRFHTSTAWALTELLTPGAERLSMMDAHWSGAGRVFGSPPEALDWMEAERANIMAVARQACGRAASQLALGMCAFFRLRGHVADWIELNMLARDAAEPRSREQAYAISDLALAQDRLGDLTESLRLQQLACEIFAEVGDEGGASSARGHLGVVYGRLGRYDAAADCHRHNLEYFRRTGNLRAQAVTLNNLGVVLGHAAPREALPCHVECLALRRQVGDRRGEAVSLANIGIIHDQLGDLPAAISHQRDALAILRAIGDLEGEANTLKNLGASQIKAGMRDEGLAHAAACLELFTRLDDAHGQAQAHHQIGLALLAAGAAELAREQLREAVTGYERLGNTADAADARQLLA